MCKQDGHNRRTCPFIVKEEETPVQTPVQMPSSIFKEIMINDLKKKTEHQDKIIDNQDQIIDSCLDKIEMYRAQLYSIHSVIDDKDEQLRRLSRPGISPGSRETEGHLLKLIQEIYVASSVKRECPICMDTISDNLQVLKCGHCYHKTCWSEVTRHQEGATCCVCRK